jgi:hypothetical protein
MEPEMNYVDRYAAALRHVAVGTLDARSYGRHTTVGDLRRTGMYIEYTCSSCLNARSFDPLDLPFGNLQLVVAVHRRMRCSFCGAKGDSSTSRPSTVRPAPTTPR